MASNSLTSLYLFLRIFFRLRFHRCPLTTVLNAFKLLIPFVTVSKIRGLSSPTGQELDFHRRVLVGYECSSHRAVTRGGS